MDVAPSISSDTRERQAAARNSLPNDVKATVDDFMERLNDLATQHGRSMQYVHLLAGIGTFKKLKKRTPSVFGVFCGKKLQEVNGDKEWGHKTTLPEFLKGNSSELKAEFDTLSDAEKDMILATYCQAQTEKVQAVKNLSNVAISKAVDAKMKLVAAACRTLNEVYQTESLVLFCHGNSAHTYQPSSFATKGAQQWLQHTEIGNNEPQSAAEQLEGFTVSGCGERIKKTQGDLLKPSQAKMISYCQTTIQDGLKSVLISKNHPCTDMMMNYPHYEDKIVERFGVELIGWPLHGGPRNPGKLMCDEVITLRSALVHNDCKWIVLSDEQLEARKASNKRRAAGGEVVYGPPRKRRARKMGTTDSDRNENSNGREVDEDPSTA